MSTVLLNKEQPLKSRLIEALAVAPDGLVIWAEFCKAVPAPPDLRLVCLVTQGASAAFATACTFLSLPNAKAQGVAAQFQRIQVVAQQVLNLASEEDATHGIIRTLSSYPQWRLVAEAGDPKTDGTALQFIIGVEIAISLVEGRPMAQAFSVELRRDKHQLTVHPDLLLESLFDQDAPLKTTWSTRLKKQLATFSEVFEGGQPRPTPKKSLKERMESQWSTKAAFATYASRAAILDSRCLSHYQYQVAMHHPRGERANEYKAAMFFMGISGFSPLLVADIPVAQDLLVEHVCYLEFSTGACHLVRNLECLAHDQASPSGVDGQPASLVYSTPLPFNVSQYLCLRMSAVPNAKTLGNLIPLLTEVGSSDALYPSLEEMEPTWAKLRPTMGRILRQHGLDNLLIALLNADFAHAAKSKIYYATISPAEIRRFVSVAYPILGYEPPSTEEAHGIAFGSKVSPTSDQICSTNQALTDFVEGMRPGNKAGLEALLAFHSNYSTLLGFQLLVLLGLRETGHIPLPGRDDVNVLYVAEKSSAGRSGGMAALMPTHLVQSMTLYRAHCKALLMRLHRAKPTPFSEWLNRAAHGDSDLDLCTCSARGLARPVATSQVLTAVGVHTRFSPDLGRKYLEDELRQRHVRTEDIDRVLRHDVLGQSLTTGTSDGSEIAWIRRIRPVMDQIAKDLDFKLTRGLGGSAK